MNLVFWAMGVVALQGMGTCWGCRSVPVSPEKSVTHVPGLHLTPPNKALERTVEHRGAALGREVAACAAAQLGR